MNRFVGGGLIVVGIILLIAGLNAQDSLSDRLSRAFTGSSTDKTIWMFIGGALAVIVGASMMFIRRGQRTD